MWRCVLPRVTVSSCAMRRAPACGDHQIGFVFFIRKTFKGEPHMVLATRESQTADGNEETSSTAVDFQRRVTLQDIQYNNTATVKMSNKH